MKDLKLRGGALMIGSLFWQDDLDAEKKDELRKNWRNDYLEENAIKVKLPIRYGRFSASEIFTMVFSKNCEKNRKFGTGFIKAFKSDINNWKELEAKAIEMSKAEGMKGNFIGGKKKIWSTMSILFNPKKIDDKVKNHLIEEWGNKIREDGGGMDIESYKFKDEEPALKKDCSLNFEWFKASNDKDTSILNDLDFIICTVTKQKNPSTNNYPTISKLAISIEKDDKRKYFKNNVKNGITTFEDQLIEKELIKNASR